MIQVKKNEPTAALRRMYFQCVDATDGMTPETGEAGGQPQISYPGAEAFSNTGIGVLVSMGNGRYYAELTQVVTNIADRSVIEGRYKSANTAEAVGTTIQIVEYPVDASPAAIKAKTDLLPADPASETSVNVVAGYVDTEVAAIKAQTDKMEWEATGGHNYLKSAPQTAVTVNPSQLTDGTIYRDRTLTYGEDIEIVRGNTIKLTFPLSSDWNLTGKKAYCTIKATPTTPNAQAIVNRLCTVIDARTCSIDLTAAETATVGAYAGAVEVCNADDTVVGEAFFFKPKIIQDVRQ